MNFLTTGDGLKLHLRHWAAPGLAGDARGTVQIVHGLGEHIGRYEALAARLNAEGWHVAGHDQRGHGRSEGARGGIGGEHSLLLDLAAVTDHLRGSGRLVLLGHSMGGLIAARFVAESLAYKTRRWVRDVDGLVLSSPALNVRLGLLSRTLLPLALRLAPNLHLGNGLKPAWLSRDAGVVQRYIADPLVHRRITPKLLQCMVHEGRVVRSRAARWRTPTLLLWSGADRCVAPAGSAAFAAIAPNTVVKSQAFPQLFHEIFNEPEREQVLGHLTRWLGRF